MRIKDTKRVAILLITLGTVFSLLGGSLAAWTWTSNNSQKTMVSVTLPGATLTIEGGNVNHNGMYPTAYCDGEGALIGDIATATVVNTTNVDIEATIKIRAILTVRHGTLTTEAKEKINWAVVDTSTKKNCTNTPYKGTFADISANNDIDVGINFVTLANETVSKNYRIYVWLDSTYQHRNHGNNISNPMDDLGISVKFSPASELIQKNTYVVYSETDNSLRFYKNSGPTPISDSGEVASPIVNLLIEDENIENTAVYMDIENTTYTSLEQVPWHEYRDSITTVIVEEPISPKSISNWFEDMKNVIYMDLSKLDTSRITSMAYAFYNTGKNSSTFEIIGLEKWNTSNVTNMNWMFYMTGENATTFDIGNIGNFDVSNVTNMSSMFVYGGSNATTWNIGDLSNWDVSNVTNMSSMFVVAGSKATTFNIGDIGNWDVSNVTNMSQMFYMTGKNATTWNIGDLSNWDVSNVTNMGQLFSSAGNNATTWNIGDLSNWDVSNVTNMSGMFNGAGSKATTFNIGNIGNWDVSNVTGMSSMFANAGSKATTFNIGDIGNWNVSNVTNMSGMFNVTGLSSSTFNIGDISNWDVSNVTNMFQMFARTASNNATTFDIGDISKWNTSNVTNMGQMFYATAPKASYSLNLSGWNVNNVTTYTLFNSVVESKVTAPTWVN